MPDAVEVRTTLRPTSNATPKSIVRAHLRGLRDASVTAAAVLVLDNTTGEVLAHVGSADFWDDAGGGQIDGARMLRQPGSALKPFTLWPGLGVGPRHAGHDPGRPRPTVVEAGGAFSPENYDQRFHGPVPLREALASSFNVPAVRVAQDVGPEALLALLRRAGFASLTGSAEHYGVGLTLGNGEVRMTELARAYAGLARGGTLPPLHTVRGSAPRRATRCAPAASPVVPMGLTPGQPTSSPTS